MDPIIISVAPNGARKTTKDHPALPVTPQTLGQTAKSCREAGAALIHLHIRDAGQGHTLDSGIYREAIAEIRHQVGDEMIIQATSEAVGIYSPEAQMNMVLEVQPEAVSLALRELVPDPAMEETAGEFFHEVLEMGIMPQYILYSPEEVAYFSALRKRGLIPGKKVFVLFVLGKKTGSPEQAKDPSASWAKPEDLDAFLECLDGEMLEPAKTIWGVCAFGGNEQACMEYVTRCGGNPRIGFENNHLMEDGTVAADNAALIRQFVASQSGGRLIADAHAAREMLKETLLLK